MKTRAPKGGALTTRELEILRLMCAGQRGREVCRSLNIHYRTMETHRARLMDKAGARSPVELGAWAVIHGHVSKEAAPCAST